MSVLYTRDSEREKKKISDQIVPPSFSFPIAKGVVRACPWLGEGCAGAAYSPDTRATLMLQPHTCRSFVSIGSIPALWVHLGNAALLRTPHSFFSPKGVTASVVPYSELLPFLRLVNPPCIFPAKWLQFGKTGTSISSFLNGFYLASTANLNVTHLQVPHSCSSGPFNTLLLASRLRTSRAGL